MSLTLASEGVLAGDTVVLDANVCILATSPASIRGQDLSLELIQEARRSNVQLVVLRSTLVELAHAFEKIELRALCSRLGIDINFKQFRSSYAPEREKAVENLEFAICQLLQYASMVDVTLDTVTINAVVSRLRAYPLDGYDALLLEKALAIGAKYILTKDRDFSSVTELRVIQVR